MNSNEFRRRNESDAIGGSADRRRDESKPLDLSQFIGTENYYSYPKTEILLTDGFAYFTANAGGGANWFLTDFVLPISHKHSDEHFLSFTLEVINEEATIKATDGNDTVFHESKIPYTDCPEGLYRFFVVDGGDHRVAMLASEY